MSSPTRTSQATAKIERMLAIAAAVGVNLDDLRAAASRLAAREQEYDGSFGATRRAEVAALMAIEIAELARAYKRLAKAVERMPSA